MWVMTLPPANGPRVFPRTGTRPPGKKIATGDIQFAGNGKGLFLTTDRDGEFARLGYLDLATGRLDYFGTGGDWDTESVALSPNWKTLAVTTNESGRSVLRLYDAQTRRPLPLPNLPIGQVSQLTWHENSRDLAFNIVSAHSPGDVYVIDVKDAMLTRWTESSVEGVDTAKFRIRNRSNGRASTD